MLILSCALVAGLSMPAVPPQTAYFPGEYYTTRGRHAVERRALEAWPGPAGLLELWRRGGTEEQRVALLLGAGAFHDRSLLPMYLEAVGDPSPRIRQAAAFGYRVLIADYPRARPASDEAAMERLRVEIQAVTEALRRESLVEVWLESLLAPEGESLTAHRGLVFRRPSPVCWMALDQLLEPEDLPLVAETYRRARQEQTRIGLLRLLESLGMRRMVIMPRGARVGWGPEVYELALDRGDAFAGRLCGRDPLDWLRLRLAAAGVRGVDPTGAEACEVWIRVLKEMPQEWWGVAARMLYRCGGPALFPSLRDPGSPSSRSARNGILQFYGVPRGRSGRSRP